jgi:phosphotransferase system HPr-like phosphotransfer protein
MTSIKVNLDSVNKVKEFVEITGKFPEDLDLAHGKYVIDAKSLMGIFSLDLSKPLDLTINSDDEDRVEEISAAFSSFRV